MKQTTLHELSRKQYDLQGVLQEQASYLWLSFSIDRKIASRQENVPCLTLTGII
jgi:hypothetical protein